MYSMSGYGVPIMLTCPCNVDPLSSHFYIIKLGFTGVFIVFLIFVLKHRLRVLVRVASCPRKRESQRETDI